MIEAPKNEGQAANQKFAHYQKEAAYDLIGKTSQAVEKKYGKPDRIDPSAYDYDWWIYKQDWDTYMQIGIFQDKVVTAFILGEKVNMKPFTIGQPVGEINKIIADSEVKDIPVRGNVYRFQLTDEEKKMVPIVALGKDIYAQLYMDTFTNQLSAVRFIDGETLIKQRPYDVTYIGDLIDPVSISSKKWEQIMGGESKQIFDITNKIRSRNGLQPVKWSDQTAKIAYKHSKEMATENYFSHTSPNQGDLADRLKKGGVFYKLAGENIAAKYVDAISVVEGWINSEGHRKTLLNKDFTDLGVGVYKLYYTQNFIQDWD